MMIRDASARHEGLDEALQTVLLPQWHMGEEKEYEVEQNGRHVEDYNFSWSRYPIIRHSISQDEEVEMDA